MYMVLDFDSQIRSFLPLVQTFCPNNYLSEVFVIRFVISLTQLPEILE